MVSSFKHKIIVMILLTNTIQGEKSTSKPTSSSSRISSNISSMPKVPKGIGNNESATTEFYFNTTKEPFEICEFNNTCNITDLYNSSDTEIPVSNFSEKIPIIKNYQVSQEYCTCDLQLTVCEINCCCDPDCSGADKTIFQYCEEQPRIYDTRLCTYTKTFYINTTPFEMEVNQDSLFCVAKSNLPPYYIVERRQPLLSYESTNFLKVGKFSWPNNEVDDEEYETAFKYGNNLWSLRNGSLMKFKLPNGLYSHRCIWEDEIRALENFQAHCSQTDISAQNEKLNLKYYFHNILIVNETSQSNQMIVKNKCSKTLCLPIKPIICNDKFENCKNISLNDAILQPKCFLSPGRDLKTCHNILKKLKYTFYHNGSHGIDKINVFLVPNNITYSLINNEDFEFYQDFFVEFLWSNQKKNFSNILSGNPGYINEKPILLGILHNYGNKSHLLLKIQRNANEFQGSFLTLPENVNGECRNDNDTYVTVQFGYNMMLKCKFNGRYEINKKISIEPLAKEVTGGNKSNSTKIPVKMTGIAASNGTVMCKNVQKMILNLWRFDERLRIGMFGNANASNIEDWITILQKDKKDVLGNETIGYLFEKKGELKCRNLIKKLKIGIFYARVDIQTLPNQNKILGVTYEFESESSNMSLIYKNNSLFFSIGLESQVVFYDITSPKRKKIVDAPSLNIKLPYDFFYPFVKVENGGTKMFKRFNSILYAVLMLMAKIIKIF